MDTPSTFPYPGARILSLWVADQVKWQFHAGASTDEILEVIRNVLNDHEERYGPRPSTPNRVTA
jgi:hypothetical protein